MRLHMHLPICYYCRCCCCYYCYYRCCYCCCCYCCYCCCCYCRCCLACFCFVCVCVCVCMYVSLVCSPFFWYVFFPAFLQGGGALFATFMCAIGTLLR
ncbi:unnamed protein product [Gongylonema pulchrum]|uniref:Uncharacterized protein n=1 Tax=Gongylonema pulchrum TaxID=637853 RepID=A0A3P7PFD2_9BILA|nr:unnamed protein product [Gongylonema pulchrum]